MIFGSDRGAFGGVSGLTVAQGCDGIHSCGAQGRIKAKYNANYHGDTKGKRDGPWDDLRGDVLD